MKEGGSFMKPTEILSLEVERQALEKKVTNLQALNSEMAKALTNAKFAIRFDGLAGRSTQWADLLTEIDRVLAANLF